MSWSPHNWMRDLLSSLSIAYLSIPGTHESAASYGLSNISHTPHISLNSNH